MPRKKKTNVESVPTELKNELATLAPTPDHMKSEITFNETSVLALNDAAEKIKQIDQQAEFTINMLSKAVKTRADVEKGSVLRVLKEQLEANSQYHDSSFKSWLAEQGITYVVASRWMNASMMVEDGASIFGEEMMLGISTSSLARMQNLPADAKLDMLEVVEKTGKAPTMREVEEKGQKLETQISKTAELLQAAREKRQQAWEDWETVKAEHKPGDAGYKLGNRTAHDSSNRVAELEKRLEELQKKLEDEERKSATEAAARRSKEEELEKMMFDDVSVREQRIKRIQSTLTVHIPQVQSDLQRFKAEYKHYPEDHRAAIDNLIIELKSFLQDIK